MRALLRRFGRGRAVTRAHDGFTLLEVLTVAVAIGTLARMAVPNVHDVVLKARAAEVAADFETVRVAALQYRADVGEWPADAYEGQVPPGLLSYLPDNFGFFRAGYNLDWENWDLPGGLPGDPTLNGLLGITVSTTDVELGEAVLGLLGNARPHYVLGTNHTFIVERK